MTASGFGGAIEDRGIASIDGASNVLLSFPTLDDRDRQTCDDLLAVDGEDGRAVVIVSLSDTPERRVDRWQSTTGDLPRELRFVTTDDLARSRPDTAEPGTVISVETVSSPRDLTGLGIAISNHLDRIGDDHDGIAFCFDSLSTLLNHADREPVYKFLHVLTAQLRSVDATAHFHIDPDAHRDQDVRAITSLFDTEVVATDDGEIDVRAR